MEDKFLGEGWLDIFLSAPILDATYEKADTDRSIDEQSHLSNSQRSELCSILVKYEKLFNGILGPYPYRKMHVDIDKTALPKHSCPYPVSHVHLGMSNVNLIMYVILVFFLNRA